MVTKTITEEKGKGIRISSIGMDETTCESSVEILNQILADTLVLRDLYKKHHWQVAGPMFYELHLLYDKHFKEQVELSDAIGERVQQLGGISVAMAPDLIELSRVPRAPRGREEAFAQIIRLLEAHEIILREAHEGAKKSAEKGDEGTNDLLISDVIRTNERQAWFIAMHLAEQSSTFKVNNGEEARGGLRIQK